MRFIYTYIIIALLLVVVVESRADVPPVCSQHYDEYAVNGFAHSSFTWTIYVDGQPDTKNKYGRILYGGMKVSGIGSDDWDKNRDGDTIRVYWNDKLKVIGKDIKLVAQELTIAGCLGDPVEVGMKYNSPDLELGDRDQVCMGGSVELQNVGADKFLTSSYKWTTAKVTGGIQSFKDVTGTGADKSILSVASITQSQTFSVEAAESVSGCRVRDTLILNPVDIPVVNLGRDTMLCAMETLELDPLIEGGDDYRWYINGIWLKDIVGTVMDATSGEKQIVFEARNFYSNLYNPADQFCATLDTINILQCNQFKVDWGIPVAYTPNNDGVNDKWIIKKLVNFPNVTVDVYTRWGTRVFSSRGYNSSNAWDGRDMNGNELGMDSYHYIIDLNDGSPKLIGTVTLVR